MKRVMAAAAGLALLGGCDGGGEEGNAGAQAPNAAGAAGNGSAGAVAGPGGGEHILRAPDGAERGNVTLLQTGEGLAVRVAATGLPAGTHGAHLHAVGRCDPPDFSSAGPHWNPSNRQHGTENPSGPHMGDLPNLTVAADGTGTLDFTVPGGQLQGGGQALLDTDGAAFVIHADPDDYRTDPSGDSGGRIACAVIGASG